MNYDVGEVRFVVMSSVRFPRVCLKAGTFLACAKGVTLEVGSIFSRIRNCERNNLHLQWFEVRQGGEGCVWETLLHCVCWGWFGGPALPVTVRLSGFRVAFNKFKQLLGGKSAFRSSFKCSRAVQGCVSWPLLGCVGWGRFGGHALGVTVRLSGFDIFSV